MDEYFDNLQVDNEYDINFGLTTAIVKKIDQLARAAISDYKTESPFAIVVLDGVGELFETGSDVTNS